MERAPASRWEPPFHDRSGPDLARLSEERVSGTPHLSRLTEITGEVHPYRTS